MLLPLALLVSCAPATDDGGPAEGDADTDTDTDTDTDGAFTLTIPALYSSEGNPLADECDWVMPAAYECYSANPEVRWTGVPAGTVAFALVLDDPDAGDFAHWAVVNVPGEETGLAAGISGQSVDGDLPGDAYELENGFGFTGYLGSCPPEPHVYRWRLWALSAPLDADLTRFAQVENQAGDVALGLAETCHIYGPAVDGSR